MKRSVVFFEVEGGNDKGPNGHRRDTVPMIESVRAMGWTAEVVYYSDKNIEQFLTEIPASYDAFSDLQFD